MDDHEKTSPPTPHARSMLFQEALLPELTHLAETQPDVALSVLMADQDTRRGLSRGRARLLASLNKAHRTSSVPATSSPASVATQRDRADDWMGVLPLEGLAMRLWRGVTEIRESLEGWFTLPVLSPALAHTRGEETTTGLEATVPDSLLLSFGDEVLRYGDYYCQVFSLEGESVHRLYPRGPGAPTRARDLGEQVWRLPLEGTHRHLLVVLSRERPLPFTAAGEQPQLEAKWLEARLEDATRSDVILLGVSVDLTRRGPVVVRQ